MKSQTGRRRWVGGALRAGRAAAFLTLATGINGTLAVLEPRYEPIYVYLVAVVIVAWLGGVLLGVTAAVAAVVLYDSMFAPVPAGPSLASVVPFVVAIGAAVLTALARSPLERKRFAPAPQRPLLEPTPTVVSVTPTMADTAEVDDLRLQLADAGRQLDEARAATEKESRLRSEASAAARVRLAGLQHDLDSSRNDALEQARRASTLQAQLDEASRRGEESGERLAALQGEVESSRARLHELEARLEETTQELEVAWKRVDEEKSRSDGNEARLHELERQANDALQRAVADLASRYEEPLAAAKESLAEAFTRIPLLEKELDEARRAFEEAHPRTAALQEEIDRLGALLEQERARAAERLQAALDEAGRKQELALAEVAARLSERMEALQHEKEQAIADGERRRAEAVAGYTSRLQSSEARAAALQQKADDARTAVELERAQRERVEADLDRKIASIAAGLTSDYEASLGEALVEKEAARAEVRELTSKVTSLQKQLAEQSELLAGAREEEARRGSETLSDYSARLMHSEARAAAGEQEIERLQGELEDARSRAELERAERERVLADFDRKIASIVTGITSDSENAIAEALVEKEAARAEARAAASRIESLQRKLLDFDTLYRQVEKSTADLREAVDRERRRADTEKAAREELDADWNEKLQTIVAHLATDHEADLGEALLQKEAARAEARNLGVRLRTLEQRLEKERTAAVAAEKPTLTGNTARPALVLVVHSDAGMRAMSKHALEQDGYSVTTAADGLEGLRMAAAQLPDVVLAEAVMPKMNGRELVQLLKARSETAGVKVVLMSSEAGNDTGPGSDFRADDFLPSPADLTTMRAMLASVLAK